MRKILINPYFWLFVIVLLAAILRFYKLSEYLQFLGDQGRDMLVVKRMLIDHKWTLLGPSASVGGFYTGAIYYYFMLPFVWLFNLDPVGPAVLNTIFGVGTVILIYCFTSRIFGIKAALIAAFLTAISPGMIYVSRYSWNPNPIPFFSLLTIFLLYLSIEKRKASLTLLSAVGLGLIVQLHYMALAMVPVVFFTSLILTPKKDWLKNLIVLGIGFLIGESLFILFEVRHNFANLQHVLEFITRGDGQNVSPRGLNIFSALDDVLKRIFEAVFGFRGWTMNLFYYGSIVSFIIWAWKQKRKQENKIKITILSCWLLVGAFTVSLYHGSLYDHYFVALYPIVIIIISLLLSQFLKKKYLIPIFILVFSFFLFFEIKSQFFWQKPNNLIKQTQTIDKQVLKLTGGKPFNFALISHGNSDSAYRYFLEIWGKIPSTIENPEVDPSRSSVTKQLIVVCEEECGPLGASLWEIAGFGRAEIVHEEASIGGIKIYKLVHYTGK